MATVPPHTHPRHEHSQYVELDSGLFVPTAGGTMTGDLTLSGAPTADLHASTKKYVDDADALRVAKAGDTMTGPLVISNYGLTIEDSNSALAATNETVETALIYKSSGFNRWALKLVSTTRNLILNRYNASGVIQDAPLTIDGSTGRVSLAQGPIIGSPDSSGTQYNGTVWLSGMSRAAFRNSSTGIIANFSVATPTDASDATTKAYVDAVATTTNFTPTIGGFTVNSQDCKYVRSNGIVQVGLFFNVATVTGPVTITLPVTPHASVEGAIVPVSLRDSGAYTFQGFGILDRGNNRIRVYGIASGTAGRLVDVSSTVPWTWNSGDVIAASFSYIV